MGNVIKLKQSDLLKIVKSKINESSYSRIWQHITNNDTFGVISPYKSNLIDDDNRKRYIELIKEVKTLGYGYIPLKGGYTYLNGDTYEEQTLFIPKIKKDQLLGLGRKYEQETVIFKDNTQFSLINCNDGKVEMEFKKDGITFDPETLKYAFSQFSKSKNRNALDKFAYVVKEGVAPSKLNSYRTLKEKNDLPPLKWVDLF